MKDAENINVPVVPEQVCNSVLLVKQDAHVPRRCGIAVTELRELNEVLRALVERLHCASRSVKVIFGDVLEDVFKPLLSLGGPRYLCPARIRRRISSFEIIRPASESASPL
jgi:hypothetical protein